jgi:ferredoxin like protein
MTEKPAAPTLTLEQKLYLLTYRHDRHSHITIRTPDICQTTCGPRWGRPCTTFCPAGVYAWDGEKITASYENCVECTSCLTGCPYHNIDWRLPRGGFGVLYRTG